MVSTSLTRTYVDPMFCSFASGKMRHNFGGGCLTESTRCFLGNLSINIFLPVLPIEMYRSLVTFLFAGSSSRFPTSAALRGFSDLLHELTLTQKWNDGQGRLPRTTAPTVPTRILGFCLLPARSNEI